MRLAIIAVVVLALTGAATEAALSADLVSAWGGSENSAAWDADAQAAVASSALPLSTPTDVTQFCPNYAALDTSARVTFWVSLLASVATQESADDAAEVHWLVYDRAAHRPTFRRGLFQISIESAHSAAYQCDVTDADELTSPGANIACATRILDRGLAATNSIARGGAYWASLRHRASATAIATTTSSRAPCASLTNATSESPQ